MIYSKADLLDELKRMIDHIESDDSFAGTLTYQVADSENFNVEGFYRVGNSMGQGGAVVIEREQPTSEGEG